MSLLELSFASGESSLSVRRVQVHEAVSALYTVSVWARSPHFDLDLESRARKKAAKGQPGGEGKQTGFLELGMGFGFGVGTGQQIDPPLDNSEVTDKGFLVEGHFSAGKVFGGGLGVGVTVPVSMGYYFKSGFANDAGNQYLAAQGAVLLIVRGKIKLK